MSFPQWIRAALAAACLAAGGWAGAQTPAPQGAATAQATVRAFHEALRRGDTGAVQQLLAADAVVLENGHAESRDEYLRHHLAADVEFAKAVPSRITDSQVTVAGTAAWVRSTSVAEGSFRQRALKLNNAELMVLTPRDAGWEIRAIHWSSQAAK